MYAKQNLIELSKAFQQKSNNNFFLEFDFFLTIKALSKLWSGKRERKLSLDIKVNIKFCRS